MLLTEFIAMLEEAHAEHGNCIVYIRSSTGELVDPDDEDAWYDPTDDSINIGW